MENNIEKSDGFYISLLFFAITYLVTIIIITVNCPVCSIINLIPFYFLRMFVKTS